MLGAVERRFGSSLPSSPVEWLTDNGSAYRTHQTRSSPEWYDWSLNIQQ
jgi:putative transposase